MIIDFVDTLFSAVHYIVERKKRRVLRKGNRFVYVDKCDFYDLERCYARWKLSGKTLDDYFGVTVVICSHMQKVVNSQDNEMSTVSSFRSKVKSVESRPIFVGQTRNSGMRKSSVTTYHVINLNQVNSLRPIEMSEKVIADLHGLPNSRNLVELYKNYNVNFKYLHVDLSPKRIKSGSFVTESADVPGDRMFDQNCKEIRIGKSTSGQTFWVPSSMYVNKQLFCRKNAEQCTFWTYNATNLLDHEKSCITEPIISTRQKIYGISTSLLDDLIDEKLLPEKFRNYSHSYMATYDIETLERPCDIKRTNLLTTNSHHLLVSIGVSTNIPGFKDTWFCRRSSDEADGTRCVTSFLKYLQSLQKKLETLIPCEILSLIAKLQEKTGDFDGRPSQYTYVNKLNFLRKFTQLSVYGFNSGKQIYLLLDF